MPPKIQPPKNPKQLPQAIVKQMLVLATSGFGVVAALAWNNVIKEAVDVYIKPYLGQESGLVSLFTYAIIVTALAVIITLQLSKISEKLKT